MALLAPLRGLLRRALAGGDVPEPEVVPEPVPAAARRARGGRRRCRSRPRPSAPRRAHPRRGSPPAGSCSARPRPAAPTASAPAVAHRRRVAAATTAWRSAEVLLRLQGGQRRRARASCAPTRAATRRARPSSAPRAERRERRRRAELLRGLPGLRRRRRSSPRWASTADLLGPVETFRFPPDGDAAYVSLALGEGKLGLGADPSTAARANAALELCVHASDCDDAVEHLRRAGVTIVDEPAEPGLGRAPGPRRGPRTATASPCSRAFSRRGEP